LDLCRRVSLLVGVVGGKCQNVLSYQEERPDSLTMRLLKKLFADERGGEIIEYALVGGLIAVAAIAVIGAFGTKVMAKWTSINSSL
jgi:Flp pilus assembly pilin Flp